MTATVPSGFHFESWAASPQAPSGALQGEATRRRDRLRIPKSGSCCQQPCVAGPMYRRQHRRHALLPSPVHTGARSVAIEILKLVAGGDDLAPRCEPLQQAELALLAVLQLVDDHDRERSCHPPLDAGLIEQTTGQVTSPIEIGGQCEEFDELRSAIQKARAVLLSMEKRQLILQGEHNKYIEDIMAWDKKTID